MAEPETFLHTVMHHCTHGSYPYRIYLPVNRNQRTTDPSDFDAVDKAVIHLTGIDIDETDDSTCLEYVLVDDHKDIPELTLEHMSRLV